MPTTTRLAITKLVVAQEHKEVSINSALDVIDAAVVRVTGDTMTGGLKVQRTAVTSGSPDPSLWVVQPADTGMTASTEASGVVFDLSSTRQFATGALTTQRAMRILAPTYAFVGASVITTASTVSISGPPAAGANATITNPYSLNVEAGSSLFGGQVFVTPTSSGRCMTLNHFPTFVGATLAVAAETGKRRAIVDLASAFQLGTDVAYNNTADFWWNNVTTGNNVLTISPADLVTVGSAAVAGGAVLGKSGGKIAFFDGTPVVKQANASQTAITAVADANAKSALQAIYDLLKNYGIAPATA